MVTALKVVRALERNPPNERLIALLSWREAHPRQVVPSQAGYRERPLADRRQLNWPDGAQRDHFAYIYKGVGLGAVVPGSTRRYHRTNVRSRSVPEAHRVQELRLHRLRRPANRRGAESGRLGLLPRMPVRMDDFHDRWSCVRDHDSVADTR